MTNLQRGMSDHLRLFPLSGSASDSQVQSVIQGQQPQETAAQICALINVWVVCFCLVLQPDYKVFAANVPPDQMFFIEAHFHLLS